MRRLKVEFAPPHRPVFALMALGLVSAAITIALGVGAFHAWERRQALVAQFDKDTLEANQLRSRLAKQTERTAKETKTPPYASDAHAIAQLAKFPLQRALRALETVAVDGIKLTSITANAAQGTVDVQLEFDDYKGLVAYVEQLNDGEPSPRWNLVSAGDSGQRKQAAIRSTWR